MSDLFLKWTSHLELLASLEQLLLDKSFVDVTIAVEGQILQAHKVILCASSPYFNSILQSNPTPHPIIFMRDVKYVEMKAILDFVYKGEVNLNQEHISGMLKTAKALKVTGLCNISWTESMSYIQSDDSSSIEKDDIHIHVVNSAIDTQSISSIGSTTKPQQSKVCTEIIQLHETSALEERLSSNNVLGNRSKTPSTITQQDMVEFIQDYGEQPNLTHVATSDDGSTVIVLESPPEVSITSVPVVKIQENTPGRNYTKEDFQQDYGESSLTHVTTSDDGSTVMILETSPEVSITSVPSTQVQVKHPGRQYTKKDLQQALDMVRQGQMGIKPAARAFNIPVATLHHAARRNKIASPLQQGGNRMLFYKAWQTNKEKGGSSEIVSSDWTQIGK